MVSKEGGFIEAEFGMKWMSMCGVEDHEAYSIAVPQKKKVEKRNSRIRNPSDVSPGLFLVAVGEAHYQFGGQIYVYRITKQISMRFLKHKQPTKPKIHYRKICFQGFSKLRAN